METKSGPNSEIPHDYKPYLTLDIVKQDTFQNTMGPENLFRSVIMHHLPRVEDMPLYSPREYSQIPAQ